MNSIYAYARAFRWPFACIPSCMRPLAQDPARTSQRNSELHRARTASLSTLQCCAVFAATILLHGSGGGSAGSGINPPPPPPPQLVSITITPTSSSILLGNSLTFSATVKNATNTNVTWSVNGVPGGSASTGTISSSGVFTAPTDLPAPAAVNVTATSEADTTKSATAQLTITSDITIALTPTSAGVELGATQSFHATIGSAGHPDTTVRWSLSDPSCPTACGTIDLGGNYTAPTILPAPATGTLTAQSVADPSKQASAPITITSKFTLQIAAPESVPAGSTASVVATLTPVPGSNPSTNLS